MPRKCKSQLMLVTATIAYYMELQEITNKSICEKMSISSHTWIDKKKNPDKFTLGDLSILAKVFKVDMLTLVGGLVPNRKGHFKCQH